MEIGERVLSLGCGSAGFLEERGDGIGNVDRFCTRMKDGIEVLFGEECPCTEAVRFGKNRG